MFSLEKNAYYNKKEGEKDMETVRPRGTDKAKVIQVIQTKSMLGRGIPEDPVRIIYQYWDFKGNLLAENDTLFTGDLLEL